MTIGQRIKDARLMKGFTQEELGQRIGVKKAAINKYETGIVVNLKQSTIANLAQALDVDPVWLIGMSDQARTTRILDADAAHSDDGSGLCCDRFALNHLVGQ